MEIHIAGDRAESCSHLLAWRDTLTDTSLYLQLGDGLAEPHVDMSGRFCDGTAVTITAPLGEDDVTDLTSNQVGDQVLSWLTTHAL